MTRRACGFGRDERGQAAVLVALMFLTMVLVVAVVVNIAQLLDVRRSAQTAADAAALAAAASFARGDANSQTTALAAAGLNGYVHDGSVVTVTVNRPPATGPHTGDANFVEVIVVRRTTFLIASNLGPWNVTTRAVAGQAAGGVGDSAFAGGTGDIARSLEVGNQGSLTLANGCSATDGQGNCTSYVPGTAQVNSSSPAGPNAAVYNACPSGGNIGPAGAVVNVVGGSCGATGPATMNPGAVFKTDPYFGWPMPEPTIPDDNNWCRKNNWNANTNPCAIYTDISGGGAGCAQTLYPGLYTRTVSGNCAWTFEPGIYIFRGRSTGAAAGLSLSQGSTVSVLQSRDPQFGSCGGTGQDQCGVLLFFTYFSYPEAVTGNCATLSIQGGSQFDLTPEPDGTWMGFLIFYDPRCSGDLTLGGNAAINLATAKGLIYTPSSTLVMNGSGTTATLSRVVTNKITVSQGTLVVDVATLDVVPLGVPRLAE